MFSKSFLGTFLGLAATSLVAAQSNVPAFSYGSANPNAFGVKSRNKNGPTNPSSPQLGTPINQTSVARLASINDITDWCTFGPGGTGQPLGDVEGETVAWCTKARNNARVIPDGTLTAVHFVKTPLYLQVMAAGDFTKLGLVAGDEGGELDPHGATNMGNPVGGNVTSNVSGKDVFYEEWMNYISYNQVCFRVCIAASDQVSTEAECQHTLDVMGCNFVMPGNYADNSFDTCDGDSAYPPGLYPQADGSTSTFQQYFSSVYTDPSSGNEYTFVNGKSDQATPSAAYSLPSTSNCVTTTSMYSGGVAAVTSAAPSTLTSTSTSTAAPTTAPSTSTMTSTVRPASTASTGSNGAASIAVGGGLTSLALGAVAGVVGLLAVL